MLDQCSIARFRGWVTRFFFHPSLRSGRTASALLLPAALGALALSCGASPPAPRTRDIVVWQEVGSWKGSGTLQTESFLGDTGMLRIRWDAEKASATDGMLRVTVHSAISGRPLAVAVDHQGAGGDTAYVNEDPRVFYLVVESSELDWSVAVDEGMAAIVTDPVAHLKSGLNQRMVSWFSVGLSPAFLGD